MSKGIYRGLDTVQIGYATENQTIFRYLDDVQRTPSSTNSDKPFYERYLDATHSASADPNSPTISVDSIAATDNNDGTHNLSIVVTFANAPAQQNLRVTILNGANNVQDGGVPEVVTISTSPQTITSITNVTNTGASHTVTVSFGTNGASGSRTYTSPAAGGGQAIPDIVISNFLDASTNVIAATSKLGLDFAKHSFDRGFANNPTYPAANNPILNITKKVRYFHDMQNDDYAVSGNTPIVSTPAYNPTGFARMHNNPLVRYKPALVIVPDLDIQTTLTTQQNASPGKSFPNRFWRASELGADDTARLANARLWWNAFFALYDKTGNNVANENRTFTTAVELHNEAWGDQIAGTGAGTISALRIWANAAYAAAAAFYGSSDPEDWRIKFKSGATQVYDATGRWGAADYLPALYRDVEDVPNIIAFTGHNYSFVDQTVNLTLHPEASNSEFKYLFDLADYVETEFTGKTVECTEWGWDSATSGQFAQGAYSVRSLLWIATRDIITRAYLYEDVDNPTVSGLYATSGILTALDNNRYQGVSKTAYRMLLQLKNVLGDAVVKEYAFVNESVFVLIMEGTFKNFLVVWKPIAIGTNETTNAIEVVDLVSARIAGLTFIANEAYSIDGAITLGSNLESSSRGTARTFTVTKAGNQTRLEIGKAPIIYEIQ